MVGVEGGYTAILIQSSYNPRTVLLQYYHSTSRVLLQESNSTTTSPHHYNAMPAQTDYSNSVFIVWPILLECDQHTIHSTTASNSPPVPLLPNLVVGWWGCGSEREPKPIHRQPIPLSNLPTPPPPGPPTNWWCANGAVGWWEVKGTM